MGTCRTRVLTAGSILALLAGCGGSPATTATQASGSGTVPSSAKAPPPSPATQPRLKKIVLQLTDFPPGWKSEPYFPNQDAEDEFTAAYARCLGVPETIGDKVAEAYSDKYTLRDVSVYSVAASYKSQSDLDAYHAALHSPKFSPCGEQVIRKAYEVSLPAGTIDSVSVSATPGRADGPSNVVAIMTGAITLSVQGQRVMYYVSLVFIGGPLIEAAIVGTSVGGPIPAARMESLIAKVAARAAAG